MKYCSRVFFISPVPLMFSLFLHVVPLNQLNAEGVIIWSIHPPLLFILLMVWPWQVDVSLFLQMPLRFSTISPRVPINQLNTKGGIIWSINSSPFTFHSF